MSEEIRKTEKTEATKASSASTVNAFAAKGYEKEQNNNEKIDDRTPSQIMQILYGFNITIDLATGKYVLIKGTGMDRLVAILQRNKNYEVAVEQARQVVHPAYEERVAALMDFANLKKYAGHIGHIGTIEYPTFYPDTEDYEWHELNVFAAYNNQDKPVINILGRDVTEAHKREEKNNRELKAAAARNQILSDLTKMLYSYNLTLNLNTGRYTLIQGHGMTKFMQIFKSTNDYPKAYAEKIKYIIPDSVEQFAALASLEALRLHKHNHGFIGNLEYGALTDYGEEWHEINVFIGTDELGSPIANILGRDITEAHKRQEQKELAQKAAAARDQLLSGVTKMLYSFNLTVNLDTWKYTLITGTGCKDLLQVLQASDDYVLSFYKLRRLLEDDTKKVFEDKFGIPAMKSYRGHFGYMGTITTSLINAEGKHWQEHNLFMGTNEYGEPIANILGRDITRAHLEQEWRENELRAVAAKDQILSEITKILYSYNLTLNLVTGKYNLILGTGMRNFVKIFEATDDYESAFAKKIGFVSPDYQEAFAAFSSLAALRSKMQENGYIGTLEYSADDGSGLEWHEINVFMGTNEYGEPIANILGRDITEIHNRADTEAKLKISEASSKSKTQFLFNMSHDIRTPMNAIIGFTDLLQKHLDNRQLAEQYLSKIKYSNEFLLSLINNVLEMAKIESGKETLDESECNVNEFNDTLAAVFGSQMEQKGLHFRINAHVEHAKILGDKTKSKEIFLNVLSNALKYTPAGGSVTFDTYELPSDKAGYALYKTVITDTGIGMSKEFLPHLFEEFSRERNSTESKVMGTGLGMAIVKSLVDIMQGTIEVESELGKGTTYTITIPHQILLQDNAEEAASSTATDFEFAGKRILLAEDNELNAEIAMEILDEVGFAVDRAADGVICVEMLKKAPCHYYDVILMDIQMPNMNGYEAARAIRALQDPSRNNIPILALTANAFEEDKQNAFAAGMNGHLAKPIDISKLMETLAKVLN